MNRTYPRFVVAFAAFVAATLFGCSSSSPPPSQSSTGSPGHTHANGNANANANGTGRPAAAAMAPAPASAPAPAIHTDRLYFPTGDQATSMLLLERTGPAKARVGKPYNYQITVTNLTNAPLHGVTVQELVPASFAMRDTGGGGESESLVPGRPTPAAAPPQTVDRSAEGARPKEKETAKDKDMAGGAAPRTYTIGELGPKQSRTIQLTGVPSEAGPINACTSVTGSPTLCTAALAINPQMRITKEAIGSGDLCEPQTIRYTVANTGTGDLTGVRIDDQLAHGLTTENGADRVAIDIGNVPQGQSRTADVRVKAGAAGEFSSAALATADDEVTAKSEPLAMAIKAPQIEVALKAPEKEYLGQDVRYEVTVKNVGNAVARNPVVRIDTGGGDVAAAPAAAPGEPQLAAAREGGGGQSVGELAPGASKTITIPVATRAEGELRASAIASDPCAKTATASGITRVTGLPALLLSAVDDHDPVRVGENVTYTINVLNQGFGTDKNVKVVVTLPESEQYVSSTGASEGRIDGNKLTFAPVDTIAAKQTLTWTVIVKAVKEGDVRFKVDMTTDSLTEPAVKMEPTRLY